MIKVMYSIYGDPEGPWHFASTDGKMEGGSIEINLTINGTPSHTYAKLVVPFENFNPNNLKENLKYNICKPAENQQSLTQQLPDGGCCDPLPPKGREHP